MPPGTHLDANLLELHILLKPNLKRQLNLAVTRQGLPKVLVHGCSLAPTEREHKVVVATGNGVGRGEVV